MTNTLLLAYLGACSKWCCLCASHQSEGCSSLTSFIIVLIKVDRFDTVSSAIHVRACANHELLCEAATAHFPELMPAGSQEVNI
jgi:hypothetical protein